MFTFVNISFIIVSIGTYTQLYSRPPRPSAFPEGFSTRISSRSAPPLFHGRGSFDVRREEPTSTPTFQYFPSRYILKVVARSHTNIRLTISRRPFSNDNGISGTKSNYTLKPHSVVTFTDENYSKLTFDEY